MFLSTHKAIQLFTFLFINIYLVACSSQALVENRPESWAKPIATEHLDNFYQVDPNLYRSSQPTIEGMHELEQIGIKTILNLRYLHKVEKGVKGTSLKVVGLPLLAHDLSAKDLTQSLRLIRRAKKPLLVHCYHGSDRTGAVIAAYRIVEQGWSKKEAIREMMRGGYGHHYYLFPNISEVLENLDVKAIRQTLEQPIVRGIHTLQQAQDTAIAAP